MKHSILSSADLNVVHDAFYRQMLERPKATALVFPDTSFSYSKLGRLVATFAYKLQSEYGVGPASLLMLHSNELATVISFYLAASALGASIVERNDDATVPHGHKLTHHFHTGVSKSNYPSDSHRIDQAWSPAHYPNTEIEKHWINPETPFLFTFSSGTTGLPKIVPLSHAAVLRRSLAAAYDFKPDITRFATLLPVGSRPFMARVLAALSNGSTIIDGTDHIFWQTNGVTLVSGSVQQMMMKFERISISTKIPEAEVFGARLSSNDAAVLLRSFEQVQDAIGASEVSKFYVNRHQIGEQGHNVLGQKLDSEIEILDILTGQPTLSEEGMLRVRNPYLASGYINVDDVTHQAFRDGWFYTGDTARWGINDVLDVSDRTNNIINIGGSKIHAALIDRVLSSTRGIKDAISFKNPKPNAKNEIFAFVIFEPGINQLQATEVAKLRVEEFLGNEFVPQVIRGVGGLPRLNDGSADRKACANFILELASTNLKSDE